MFNEKMSRRRFLSHAGKAALGGGLLYAVGGTVIKPRSVLGSKDKKEAEKNAWDKLKKEEKQSQCALDGVPQSLPALLQAHRLSDRAARVGFDWKKPEQVFEKIHEELGELQEAFKQEGAPEKTAWELGDLLFATTNLARHLGLCAEDLLREANRRFSDRFRLLESFAQKRQVDIKSADLETLESLWQEAKSKLADH